MEVTELSGKEALLRGQGAWAMGESLRLDVSGVLPEREEPRVPPGEEGVVPRGEESWAGPSGEGEGELGEGEMGASTSEEDAIPAEVTIRVRNVVAVADMRVHVGLRLLANATSNVFYERSKGMLTKQLRKPKAFVKVFPSGKISLTGCESEEDAKVAARKVARIVQRKVTPRARFCGFRIANLLATCRVPFSIKVDELHASNPGGTQYEPELMVGLVWRLGGKDRPIPGAKEGEKITLRIHTTGAITLTGASAVPTLSLAMSAIWPKIRAFAGPPPEPKPMRRRKAGPLSPRPPVPSPTGHSWELWSPDGDDDCHDDDDDDDDDDGHHDEDDALLDEA